MKKWVILAVSAAAIVSILAASVALAGQPPKGNKGLKGQAGESNTAFVELWEKDSNWDIVEDGAWGKMKYNFSCSEFEFLFNGHGLDPETEYCLIYYGDEDNNDVWPYATCLAGGMTNNGGNIHLAGSVNLGFDLDNAKIWLVLADDVDCDEGVMTGWNPTEYLFEFDKINYDYCEPDVIR